MSQSGPNLPNRTPPTGGFMPQPRPAHRGKNSPPDPVAMLQSGPNLPPPASRQANNRGFRNLVFTTRSGYQICQERRFLHQFILMIYLNVIDKYT